MGNQGYQELWLYDPYPTYRVTTSALQRIDPSSLPSHPFVLNNVRRMYEGPKSSCISFRLRVGPSSSFNSNLPKKCPINLLITISCTPDEAVSRPCCDFNRIHVSFFSLLGPAGGISSGDKEL